MSAVPSAAMQALLLQLQTLRAGQPNRYGMPFPESRAQLLTERQVWLDDGPDCDDQARTVVALGRTVAMHVVRPNNARAGRRLIYLHGGGWCVGAHATHANIVRRLAAALACEAWSIDYVLAPEAPFPEGLRDCIAALRLAQQQYPDDELIIAGDSAGANLALGAAVALRDQGHPLPAALLLFYGIYTASTDDASMRAFGDGRYGLSLAANDRYLQAYLPAATLVDGLVALPLDAAAAGQMSLRGLPPVWMCCAGLDILHDQSPRMATALRAAGNRVELLEVPGVIHGFLSYGKVLPEVAACIAAAGTFVAALPA